MDGVRLAEYAILAAFVVAIIYTDARFRRIPNALTYPAMLAGLLLGAAEGVPGGILAGGLLDHAAGGALAFLVSWPLYAGGGIKAGDGKFLMAVGALRGTAFLVSAAFYGALAGGVVALVYIAARRLRPGGRDGVGSLMKEWIPYGIALGIGALLALVVEARGPAA